MPESFDLEAARKAGFNDDDIVEYLAPKIGFNLGAAREAGFDTPAIIDSFATRVRGLSPAKDEIARESRSMSQRAAAGPQISSSIAARQGLIANAMQPQTNAPAHPGTFTPQGQTASAEPAPTEGGDAAMLRDQAAAQPSGLMASVDGAPMPPVNPQDQLRQNLANERRPREPQIPANVGPTPGVSLAPDNNATTLAGRYAPAAGNLASYIYNAPARGVGGLVGGLGQGLGALTGIDAVLRAGEAASGTAEQWRQQQTPDVGGVAGTAIRGVGGAVEMAPSLLAGPIGAAALMGASQAGEDYNRYTRAGVDPVNAAAAALSRGGVTAATMALPMSKLVEAFGGREPAAQFLADLMVRQVGGMQAQTVANRMIETALADPDKSWIDTFKELPGEMHESALMAISGALTFTAAHAAAQRIAPRAQPLPGASDYAALARLSPLGDAVYSAPSRAAAKAGAAAKAHADVSQTLAKMDAVPVVPGEPDKAVEELSRIAIEAVTKPNAVAEDVAGAMRAIRPTPEMASQTAEEPAGAAQPPAEPAGPTQVDAAAHEAATSPQNERPEPTDGQTEAGNYAKGHVSINGMRISFENPAGSVRFGVDAQGKPWQTTMTDHYGYLRGTVGKDKDHVDVFVKEGTAPDFSGPVYVVDQIDPKTGEFDEHKAMIGYRSADEAEAAYRSNYTADWAGGASITTMPWEHFRTWATDPSRTTVPANPEGVRSYAAELKAQPQPETKQEQQSAVPRDEAAGKRAIESLQTDDNVVKLIPSARDKFAEMYGAAHALKPGFDATIARIAGEVGGTQKAAPIKGTKRSVEKILTDYSGDPTRIKDLLRATIIVNSPEQARAAIERIRSSFEVTKAGQRDFLTNEPGADGYRDAKFNVVIDGHVAEVQVNVPAMLAAKGKVHGLYEERSNLERKALTEGRKATPEELARIDELNAGMKVVYDEAWRSANSARADTTSLSKSEREIAPPLRRAESTSNGRGGSVSQAIEYTGAPSKPSETGTPSTSKNSAISTSKASVPDLVRKVAVDHFGEDAIARLEKAGILSFEPAPAGTDAAVRAQYAAGKGRIYTDRQRTETVVPDIYHEIGEHYGLRRMLGDRYDDIFRRVADARLGDEVRPYWLKVKAGYPEFAKMSEDQLGSNNRFKHEVLAQMGMHEAARSGTLLGRVYEGVRYFLRDKLGFTPDARQIGYLLAGSLRQTARVEGRPQRQTRIEPALAERSAPLASRDTDVKSMVERRLEDEDAPRAINDKLVGAPPEHGSKRDLAKLISDNIAKITHANAVLEKSKDWYERSGKSIRRLTMGNDALAEKVVRLMALYSQGNSVGGNTTATIKSLMQIAQGAETAHAGRYPNDTAKRVPAILAAKEMDTSVPGVNDKLENFYRNLHDATFGTDTYEHASTMDRWMMRLYGYPHVEDDVAGKYGSAALSPTQYKYARFVTKLIGEAYEQQTGEKLLPRQVQAALWTYVKNSSDEQVHATNTKLLGRAANAIERYAGPRAAEEVRGIVPEAQQTDYGEKSSSRISKTLQSFATKAESASPKARQRLIEDLRERAAEPFVPSISDFSDYLTRATANVSFEAVPSRDVAQLDLPPEKAAQFNAAANALIFDKNGGDMLLQKIMGGDSWLRAKLDTIGGWKDTVNLSTITRLVLDKVDGQTAHDLVNWYASAVGYIMHQDAVFWHRTDPNGNVPGVLLKVEGGMSPQDAQRLLAHMREQTGVDELGFTQVGNELRFLNADPSLKRRDFINRFLKAAESFTYNKPFRVAEFSAETGLIYHDWKGDPSGEGYLRGLAAQGPSDLLRWIRDRHADYKSLLDGYQAERAGATERAAEPALASRDLDELTPEELRRATVMPLAARNVPQTIQNIRRVNVPGRSAGVIGDAGRNLGLLLDPMELGSSRAQAAAKDFANAVRVAQSQWRRMDELLTKQFTPPQLEKMWLAADEENDLRGAGIVDPTRGLGKLDPKERAVVDQLHLYGNDLLQRAVTAGMFQGGGVPYWAPRMAAMIDPQGEVTRVGASSTPGPSGDLGKNLVTSSPNLRQRKYLTTADAEAAGKAGYGADFEFVKDIRTMPFAMQRLERAIAGRELINDIKAIGKAAGVSLTSYSASPEVFRIAGHPAFTTWVPARDRDGDIVYDKNGDVHLERREMYIAKEFEGPLRAVLTSPDGGGYRALMNIKAGAMSAIMWSPLIHNMVIWGKAIPAAPGKVLTFAVYASGKAARRDPMLVNEAIDNGLVPMGRNGSWADLEMIAKGGIEEHAAPVSDALKWLIGKVDKGAAEKISGAVRSAGNFWHNTLLWDRIGDLQMGLYTHFRDDMMRSKGFDQQTAGRIAAQFANLYAGAIPNEAMGEYARKLLNVVLFSRSFTMTNLGALQAVVRGLNPDVRAQIERDAPALSQAANTYAKRKAASMVLIDIAFAQGMQAIMSAGLSAFAASDTGDEKRNQLKREYAKRMGRMLDDVRASPWHALNPFMFEQLLPGADNEAGKENRILTGYDSQGTAQYMRLPLGKAAEELQMWLTHPVTEASYKLSPLAKSSIEVASNDAGFGRPVYQPDDELWTKAYKIVAHIMKAQVPADTVKAAWKLGTGDGDDEDRRKIIGDLTGFTQSHGARGGPEVGAMQEEHRRMQGRFAESMPDAMELLRRAQRANDRGDAAAAEKLQTQAMEKLRDAGMTEHEIRAKVRMAYNPAGRKLTPRALREFQQHATEEEKGRMDAARARRDEETVQ